MKLGTSNALLPYILACWHMMNKDLMIDYFHFLSLMWPMGEMATRWSRDVVLLM